MTTYRIVRKGRPSADPDYPTLADEIISTGLTLEAARLHCRSPYSQVRPTDDFPGWFDTYEPE